MVTAATGMPRPNAICHARHNCCAVPATPYEAQVMHWVCSHFGPTFSMGKGSAATQKTTPEHARATSVDVAESAGTLSCMVSKKGKETTIIQWITSDYHAGSDPQSNPPLVWIVCRITSQGPPTELQYYCRHPKLISLSKHWLRTNSTGVTTSAALTASPAKPQYKPSPKLHLKPGKDLRSSGRTINFVKTSQSPPTPRIVAYQIPPGSSLDSVPWCRSALHEHWRRT